MELFAFYWSLSEHIHDLKDKHVPVRCDNQNAVQWLHKMTAPIPYMPLMRQIQTILFDNNVTLYPVWVSSKANILSDLASRGELEKLKKIGDEWKNEVNMHEKFIPAKRMLPGPLFLYGKGYLDGREVPNAWGSDEIDIVSW